MRDSNVIDHINQDCMKKDHIKQDQTHLWPIGPCFQITVLPFAVDSSCNGPASNKIQSLTDTNHIRFP